MSRRRFVFAAVLAACAARRAYAVIDGFVDPNTAASPWAGVGSVTVGPGTYSGVAIAPRLALTAAHVVAGARPGTVTFNVNRRHDLTTRLRVAEIHVHPAYQGFARDRAALVHDDIAALRLAEPVPFGTPIYPLARRAPRPGERLVLVGYGAGGTSAGGPVLPADPGVKRVGTNTVEQLYPDPGGAGRIELYRFAFNPVPGGSPLESTLAGGDSGSPAFVRAEDGWQLAGINTFVYAAAGGHGGHGGHGGRGGGGVAISAYREWILSLLGQE